MQPITMFVSPHANPRPRFAFGFRLALAVFALLSAPLSARAQSRTLTIKGGEPTAEHWPAVRDSSFAIQYPPGWELNDSGVLGTAFFLFAPRESPIDSFREHISLHIDDLSEKPVKLSEYVASSLQSEEALVGGRTLEKSERLSDAQGAYHQLIFTGRQGVFRLRWQKHYRIAGRRGYVLTFTCQESRCEAYREWADRIMHSFVLDPR